MHAQSFTTASERSTLLRGAASDDAGHSFRVAPLHEQVVDLDSLQMSRRQALPYLLGCQVTGSPVSEAELEVQRRAGDAMQRARELFCQGRADERIDLQVFQDQPDKIHRATRSVIDSLDKPLDKAEQAGVHAHTQAADANQMARAVLCLFAATLQPGEKASLCVSGNVEPKPYHQVVLVETPGAGRFILDAWSEGPPVRESDSPYAGSLTVLHQVTEQTAQATASVFDRGLNETGPALLPRIEHALQHQPPQEPHGAEATATVSDVFVQAVHRELNAYVDVHGTKQYPPGLLEGITTGIGRMLAPLAPQQAQAEARLQAAARQAHFTTAQAIATSFGCPSGAEETTAKAVIKEADNLLGLRTAARHLLTGTATGQEPR